MAVVRRREQQRVPDAALAEGIVLTIEFHCPQCSRLLRTADDKVGTKAKCPQCGGPVTVPFPDESPRHDLHDDSHGSEATGRAHPPLPSAAAMSHSTACAVCGEELTPHAAYCGHCGEPVGGGPVQSRRRPGQPLELGDLFSRSWAIFTDRMGLCLAACWLPKVLVGVAMGLVWMVLAIFVGFAGNAGNPPNPAVLAPAIGVMAVGFLAVVVFGWYLIPGERMLYLRLARGEAAEAADVFRGGRFLSRMVCSAIVKGLIILSMYLACAVPLGLVIVAFQNKPALAVPVAIVAVIAMIASVARYLIASWPFIYVLVDRDSPGISCLRASAEITKGNRLTLFALFLIGGFMNSLASQLFCIGMFFTVPFFELMCAIAYCDLTEQPTASV